MSFTAKYVMETNADVANALQCLIIVTKAYEIMYKASTKPKLVIEVH